MSHDTDVQKLSKLIRGIRVAMLTSVNADGHLNSRPLATQDGEFDGDLWFFTARSSQKVDEFNHNQQVNVAYAKPDKNEYVSVSGTAELVDDDDKKKELWNPIYKAWFPDGLNDPELALLRVRVDQAQYWDAPSSTVVNLIGFAKALATGKPYEGGENKKLDL